MLAKLLGFQVYTARALIFIKFVLWFVTVYLVFEAVNCYILR
jgi:hypothetical protein